MNEVNENVTANGAVTRDEEPAAKHGDNWSFAAEETPE